MRKLTTREIYHQNRHQTSPLSKRLIVWAHNIRSMHNVGAIFRNCDAFGVQELWLSGYTPRPPRPEITKAAIGAEESVSWKSLESAESGILDLKSQGLMLAALEQTDKGIRLDRWKSPKKGVCLLLGNEVTGVDDNLLEHCDIALEIPQFGVKHSLNVSVASGVAIYAILAAHLNGSNL